MEPVAARVLIVTADMGAGHREVAAELERRLRASGAYCETVDIVRAAGRPGRRLQRTYRAVLTYAPWLFDGAMRLWARTPAPMEAFTALNAGPFEQLLAASVDRVEPDVVVSTYNLASQCLGRLRRRGRIHVPVATFVIDPGAHPYWVSDEVSLHMAPTAEAAARLAEFGAATVAVTTPVLREEFRAPPAKSSARSELGLRPDEHVVLISAGSWAAGRIARTVEIVLRSSDCTPVVLCGHNTNIRRRFAATPGVVAVPWTQNVATYLAAADVVVDNAGGLTCWEALACERPVVLYEPLAGHGRFNAAALERCGLAPWARTADELVHWIRRPPLSPARPEGRDATALILAAAGAVAA